MSTEIQEKKLESLPIDRLIMVIIQVQDVDNAVNAINEIGHPVTVLSSSGGFLGGRNVTLLVGLMAGQEEVVFQSLRQTCRQRVEYMTTSLEGAPFHMPFSTPIPVGGATAFILPVERCEVFE
jgi:uncharacterized protein YaaQ